MKIMSCGMVRKLNEVKKEELTGYKKQGPLGKLIERNRDAAQDEMVPAKFIKCYNGDYVLDCDNGDIILKNVSFAYNEKKILDDISIEIPRGKKVALVGLSGSGKSTLLNLIGGLDSPTSGEVVINGEHLEKMGASALSDWRASNVGFIFQFYNLI